VNYLCILSIISWCSVVTVHRLEWLVKVILYMITAGQFLHRDLLTTFWQYVLVLFVFVSSSHPATYRVSINLSWVEPVLVYQLHITYLHSGPIDDILAVCSLLSQAIYQLTIYILHCHQSSTVYSLRVIFSTISTNLPFRSFSLWHRLTSCCPLQNKR